MICGHCIFFRDGFCRNPKSKRTLVGYFREECDYFEQQKEKTTMQSEEKTPKLKRCCHCHRELPLEAFGKKTSTKDGLQETCKECRKNSMKQTRQRRKSELPSLASLETRDALHAPGHADEFEKTFAAQVSDEVLVHELIRRGYHGTLTKTIELDADLFCNEIL